MRVCVEGVVVAKTGLPVHKARLLRGKRKGRYLLQDTDKHLEWYGHLVGRCIL